MYQEDGLRTIEEVFDYYQAVVYKREILTEGIAQLLLKTASTRILDCACGTGLPALDLRARGFDVDCSDADELMLKQFRRNARSRGVDASALQMRWEDLPARAGKYDYVMCRGNSLVYAHSWADAAASAAPLERIERYVSDIASAVLPGGYFHVDIPRANGDSEVSYPEVTFRGKRVGMRERVTAYKTHRRWEQHVSIGGTDYEFVRNSASLSAPELTKILLNNGFMNIEEVSLTGERPTYQVMLAQKSAA